MRGGCFASPTLCSLCMEWGAWPAPWTRSLPVPSLFRLPVCLCRCGVGDGMDGERAALVFLRLHTSSRRPSCPESSCLLWMAQTWTRQALEPGVP